MVTTAAATHSPASVNMAGRYPCTSAAPRPLPPPVPIRIGTHAIAMTPPRRAAVSLTADASPRSESLTAASTAAVSGVTARPIPSPHSSAVGRMASAYGAPGWARNDAQPNPSATTSIPATMSQRGPIRATSVPLIGETARKTIEDGIRAAPAAEAE